MPYQLRNLTQTFCSLQFRIFVLIFLVVNVSLQVSQDNVNESGGDVTFFVNLSVVTEKEINVK